ncbi:TsaD/Kae1/Qri7 protein [Fusibacter sp. 3D3]|nr:TsaD/Kae1/Qri7 protein [Fusibacter sp. 3D3]
MVLVEMETGKIHFEKNELLKVKEGLKGLRQSDGFYQHVHQLADSFEVLTAIFDVKNLKAIAVSDAPRNVEGSYMPVFNAGVLFARNLANALRIPIFMFSHQEGHLMAALSTSDIVSIPDCFYGLHLSGGTTEFLRVNYANQAFKIELMGETLDLNFGQLIDRIGVEMGLAFPCGKRMDEMARNSPMTQYKTVPLKAKSAETNRFGFNISGLENYFKSLIGTMSHEEISKMLFNTIAHIIENCLRDLDQDKAVIISGGVASNHIIRAYLNQHYSQLYFAKPEYSRDNAYGVALLGIQKMLAKVVL